MMSPEVFSKAAELLASALGRTPTKNEVIGFVCSTMAHVGVPVKKIITEVCGESTWESLVGDLYESLRA